MFNIWLIDSYPSCPHTHVYKYSVHVIDIYV